MCGTSIFKRKCPWLSVELLLSFFMWVFFSLKAIAAPENFDPKLTIPPPEPPPPKPVESPTPPQQPSQNNKSPLFTLESITPNFKLDKDNFGQQNLWRETATKFKLRNGDLLGLTTGFNSFTQDDIPFTSNIPLYWSWQRNTSDYKLTVNSGVDVYNRLPVTPYLSTTVEIPVFSSVGKKGLRSLLVFSGTIEHQAYKFNAKTLDHKINYWRFRPSFYWQILPNFSLFTLGQLGYFNDGNQEFQSFSRLEKKLGDFAIAINVFTWSFQQDLGTTNGYFAPSNFLVYNGEISWAKSITSWLRCRVAGSLGKQRLGNATDNAYSYQALCSTTIGEAVELDFGYSVSNVRDRNTDDTSYLNQSFDSQLRLNF